MLAIAAWEKRASRRTQGWVGENADRSDSVLHPSQVAGKALSTSMERRKRASLEG